MSSARGEVGMGSVLKHELGNRANLGRTKDRDRGLRLANQVIFNIKITILRMYVGTCKLFSSIYEQKSLL